MKIKSSIAIVLLFVVSCTTPKTNYNVIIGSWKTENSSNNNMTEITTFFEGDTAQIRIEIGGKESEKFTFNYSINDKDGKLQMVREPNLKNLYRIEVLTDKELHLLDLSTGNRKQFVKN
ncbi:MAG: hypothetical protein KA981_00405 [Bacteroidia bacterium]|jgi:lipopolysaccharide export LptBFGC system permease protein LptF|nr:hypothetical protein [Bacteroidia bacterium]